VPQPTAALLCGRRITWAAAVAAESSENK